MDYMVPRDDPAPAGVKSWQLWFSLAAGTAVWVIHLLLVYALTSLTCEWGWFPFEVGGLAGLKVVQISITLVTGAVTILAGSFAFQNQRRLADATRADSGRHYFMARLGLALNLIYTALIAVSLIPILIIPPCAL